MKLYLAFSLALVFSAAFSSAFNSSESFAGEAVLLQGSKRAVLKSSAWEQRDSTESAALLAIADDPKLTETNWGVVQAVDPLGNEAASLVADNSLKVLPAESLDPGLKTIRVLDHMQVTPAHLVSEQSEPVYKEIQVEAGSAAIQ